MKCIHCGTDSKLSERATGLCPKCHKRFAFEPRKGDPFTDAAFQNAIDAVSARGHLRWGAEHLFYELARRQRSRPARALAALIVFLVISLVVLARVRWLGLAMMLMAVALYFRRRSRNRFLKLDQSRFDALLKTWQVAHGVPKGMIVRALPRGTPAPPRPLEADITDYSFDRAVICDRARTADLLLANNFHFENNCAVLSVDGYPEAQFETVRAMLKRNPRLRVFALHDATPQGCRLARTLATDSAWFVGQGKVTDVGLRPGQARAFSGLFRPRRGNPPRPGNGISASDAVWLSAHELELAAIRPEQVLKRLYKAITRNDSGDGGGDSGGSSGSDGTGGHASDTFAGGGGENAGGGASVSYDADSFAHEAGDTESDSDGFG